MSQLIIGTGKHRQHFRRLLETTCGVVRIASAYITESLMLGDVGKREVRLLTALNKEDIIFGATSLDALRRLIENGVECRFVPDDPRLHAKVYIFGDVSAVVTSANFTRRAMNDNIEVGAILDENAVRALTTWFEELWNSATVLDAQMIAELKQETALLRIECSGFRARCHRTVHAKSPGPAPKPPTTPVSYFLCNSNRAHDRRCEPLMKAEGYAAAWETFLGVGSMRQVQPGDIVLLYANGIGIVAIGRAQGNCETLSRRDSRRLFNGFSSREWRIPVHWVVQVGDEDACPWPGVLPPTFQNVSGDRWGDQRDEVIRHFFDESEIVEELGLRPSVAHRKPPTHA